MPKKRKVEVNEDDEDLNSDTKPTENVHVKNYPSSSSSKEDLTKLLEPFTKQHLIQILLTTALNSPKILKQINQVADHNYAHRKLFVHGLNRDTTTPLSLQLFFSKYGEIEDSLIIVDKETHRSKGFGFIVFKTREDAEKALKDRLKTLDNRFIFCCLMSDRSSNTRPSQQDLFQRKIYVGNVHTEIPAYKLYDLFSKYGEIEKGPLGFDINTGKARGFAFFVYKTVEGAKKALEEPIKSLTGYPLMYCDRPKGSPSPSPGLHECGVHYNPGFTSMGSFGCGGAGGLRGCGGYGGGLLGCRHGVGCRGTGSVGSGGLLGCGHGVGCHGTGSVGGGGGLLGCGHGVGCHGTGSVGGGLLGCGHGVGCHGTGSVGGCGGLLGCHHGVGCRGTGSVGSNVAAPKSETVPVGGGVGGDMQGPDSLFTMFMFHLFFILFCFLVLISK